MDTQICLVWFALAYKFLTHTDAYESVCQEILIQDIAIYRPVPSSLLPSRPLLLKRSSFSMVFFRGLVCVVCMVCMIWMICEVFKVCVDHFGYVMVWTWYAKGGSWNMGIFLCVVCMVCMIWMICVVFKVCIDYFGYVMVWPWYAKGRSWNMGIFL